MTEATCAVCGVNPVHAVDRCGTCYSYFHTHGEDRSPELVARQVQLNRRRHERGPRAPRPKVKRGPRLPRI